MKNVNKFLLTSKKLVGEERRFKSVGISLPKKHNYFCVKRNRTQNLKYNQNFQAILSNI